ncbi:4Fe-4S dicluster domain-containing protein [Sulfurivirga sp.]|uniref:4Fe-4S dicluster domain-containing protein n=1 Tax=Sulfurivirga sp. TaxID=2614236 RepID=UPI0025FF6B44|nr:4Fe-4S dicluster domain-containing protein [Sulfurivirga sp.]
MSELNRDGTKASLLDEYEVNSKTLEEIGVEILPVNTGKTVHAKRIPGHYRTLKWIAASVWLTLFFGPYLRWNGEQAILWDLPNRQFHFFGITILPQDIWVLAMILLFFALLLAAVTAIAGRVWCGYFCFHTVWTDVFTWLEEKFEGPPAKRIKLDQQPLNWEKIKIKLPKHLVWLLIGFATSFSFLAFFTDAFDLWKRLFHLDLGKWEWLTIIVLGLATYFFAGFMREQVCIGFCPYARIQGAMIDEATVVPTYDKDRGEPRAQMKERNAYVREVLQRLKKEGEEQKLMEQFLAEGMDERAAKKKVQETLRQRANEEADRHFGDCIDCHLCVDVCPTGVDIRLGQQFGCITCGLCIDACDSIMEKIKKPKGLIRYASLDDFLGKETPPWYKRPRVLIYITVMSIAAGLLLWKLTHLDPIDVKALHDRAPLFVQMSDGTIQNKYTVKIVNKTPNKMMAKISVEGPEGLVYLTDRVVPVEPGTVGQAIVRVRLPKSALKEGRVPIRIIVQDQNHPEIKSTYESVFIGPKH